MSYSSDPPPCDGRTARKRESARGKHRVVAAVGHARTHSVSRMRTVTALVAFVLLASPALAQRAVPAPPDPLLEGAPFDRYLVEDALGRTVTAYLSVAPSGADGPLPLIVLVQGSGCESLFTRAGDAVAGGMSYLLFPLVHGRARILIVEKPGVAFLDATETPGSAEGCSAAFRQEHTLDRWAEAVVASTRAARALPGVDPSRTLAAGHSEGGIVAARVAAQDPAVTHVASLAGGGPTQLYDMAALARAQAPEGQGDAAADAVYAAWGEMMADPESADKMVWGHPYRRWATFAAPSVIDELERTDAAVFVAQGQADTAVAPAGGDVLVAELRAQGRDVEFARVEGDHGFGSAPGDLEGIRAVFARMADWFLDVPPRG